jgi:hypothetical protein
MMLQLAWVSPPERAPLSVAWGGNTAPAAEAPQGSVIQRPGDMPPTATPTPAPTAEDEFFVAPTPSFLPTLPSFRTTLSVGARAVVTNAGNQRGLRTEPQPDAPAIILLFREMRVNVLEGPVISGGYIWWRVQTSTGVTGWAIEGANGETWLEGI